MGQLVVCKFGGSSLADATQFRKVKQIVESNEDRRFVVPSAPGKRRSNDYKITDLLYLCHGHAEQGIAFDEVFGVIKTRFCELAKELEVDVDIESYLEEIKNNVANGASADYTASRGEYLNGVILAKFLGVEFVDAAEVVCFDDFGTYDAACTEAKLQERLNGIGRAVIPGFYGATTQGEIKTFSRGGSDISGAIVAGALNAKLYENWTDVSGFLMTDPRIVKDPKPIECLYLADYLIK